ncbi:hypothetical protein NIES806_41110 [Dolichospermum compactum NIES-806]|uniref:Uncharacterized protein n=1 Tax=Dolichospermum compactum NIES-806 TaxID=1973481 RepID=A0A1Z4V989_9CYAN|nr:hypothetical protein NIES806_41110 [Dolichospermum compactum NIES-806]
MMYLIQVHTAIEVSIVSISIPCPFFGGRVKRQRNQTHLLGYGYRHTMIKINAG